MSKVACAYIVRYGQPLISKDYNYTIQYINVQQILVVTFEFTGAARVFMIMSCAARGVKKVGQHCSMPPMFVFPRVNFREQFIRDGPTGSIGLAHPSDWMTDMNFIIFLRHLSNMLLNQA